MKPNGNETGKGDFINDCLTGGRAHDNELVKEVWDGIILGAISDQHAVMKSVGGLPPEWEAKHKQNLAAYEARKEERMRVKR